MMLVGAYQEVMGNNHNLFGVPHEAHIFIGEDGYIINKVIYGATLGDAVVDRHDSSRSSCTTRSARPSCSGSRTASFRTTKAASDRILRGPGRKLYIPDAEW